MEQMKKKISCLMVMALIISLCFSTIQSATLLDGKYDNGRFGFSVKYPKKLMRPSESFNGDGATLYYKGGTDVRTYAGYTLSSFNETVIDYLPKTITTKMFDLKHGYLVYDADSNKSSKTTIMVIQGNNTIHYHLDFTMQDSFYKKNKSMVFGMIKSFSPLTSKTFKAADLNYYISNFDNILAYESKAVSIVRKKVNKNMYIYIKCNLITRINGKTYLIFDADPDGVGPSYAVEYQKGSIYIYKGPGKALQKVK